MKRLGSPIKIWKSLIKICGSQRKSVVSDEFIWRIKKEIRNQESATKIWDLNEKLGVSYDNLGVSKEKLGLYDRNGRPLSPNAQFQ